MSFWQPQKDGDDPMTRDSLIVVVPVALTFAIVFLVFFWDPLVNFFGLAK